MPKLRITVTLDESLVDGAREAVSDGRSESVSALVGEALRTRLENDQRLVALREALAAYESEHGAFTPDEMADLERRDRSAADAVDIGMREAG